ncbi:MAG: hypothetical protein IJN09_04390 [Oscillospiraceae bacterium]|nr:hypothetical protein [Oscillospiraceae bacterium]
MEATEEMVSELANTALDVAVMRDNSEYRSYISELEASGMSRAEAEKEAFFQYFGKNILLAGAGGAISGVAMGGGASAISGINTNINRNRAGGGFVPTKYSDKITNKQIRALDAVGKRLGVKISIGAPTGNADGAHDGYYENGEIVIAQDAKNPLEVVLAHEVAHHMKSTAPAEYSSFLAIAMNEEMQKAKGKVQNDERARDEIAARFTQKLVNDTALFERVAQSDKSTAQKLLDGVKSFTAKVRSTFSGENVERQNANGKVQSDTAARDKFGAKTEELERATYLWEKMLSNTETAVASGNKNTVGTNAGGGKMYSLKSFEDGKRFVDVETDQNLFDGLTDNEKGKMATKIIKERFAGKVVGRDNKVFVNGRSATEYGHPSKKLDAPEQNAKMRASTELDNLIDAGDNFRTAPDGADGHIHPKATGDFKYFDTIFKVGDEYFEGRINILPNAKGDRLIDVTRIKNITQDICSSYGENPKSTFLRDNSEDINSSNISIPKTPPKVNRQNSLKTEDLLSPDYVEGDSSAEPQNDTGVDARDTEVVISKKENQKPSDTTEKGSQSSYIEDTGLDTYFNDLEDRAQVIQKKRVADAERTLMYAPNTDKKSGKEKVEESVSFLKRKMVNSADTIRKIAKTTKDKHLYPALNRARSSMNIVSDMLQNKQTNIRGQKVGESLEGIVAPIKEKGDEYFRKFQLYLLHKHNVSRMSLKDTKAEAQAQAELELFIKENPGIAAMGETALQKASMWDDDKGFRAKEYIELREKLNRAQNTKNKPIFFDSDDVPLNADESRHAAEELLHENPGFAEDEKKIRTYLDNLMQYRVDSGLITQEEADYFKKKYPDYVPTYRDTENVRKQMQGKTNIGTTVGRATGGNDPIIPLDVALSEMTKKVVRSGQKNIFANKVFDLFDKNSKLLEKYITDVQEGERDVDAEIDSFGEEAAFDNTVTFHKDGKLIELTVTPELFEAFDTLSRVPKEQPAAAQAWRKVNEVYKKLITTYDVTFIARNGLKDLFDGIFQSRNAGTFLKNYGRAYKEIATGGEMWELYQAAGGLYSSRFEELQEKGITEKSGKLNIKEKLAFGNMMVEQAPRLAEFMSVVEKGDINDADTIADALLAAADVTTNFGESGTWGKVLNAYYIPFLNPAIHGTAKVVRTFTESKTGKEWIGLAVKCMIYGLGAGFLNDLINGDDEDYENLPDRTKDNYFLIRAGDGKFLRLPKGRIMAALGVVTDRLRDVMKGEKVDAGEALSRISENILPENPLNNNIFKAWFDADLLNDESKGRTWYGTDIENETLQSLPAGERYDNSTDYVSKAIGKALGVSPKKLNYILQQYTGGIGRTVLPMITPKEQKGDSVAGKIGYGLLGILTSNFTTDSKLSNKISGEFYDAVDAATQKKNSEKGTLADKVVYKHLNRERNMVGEYSSKVREAEVDKNLTSKERQAAVRAASAERTAYQKTILENLDKYRESVEKYLKKYPGEDEEKKLEYAYREANRAMYGEEYAIRANGGSDVYKKAQEKVKRGKTTWAKYYDEYFGKAERRFEKISDRFGISYAEFEKIADAISKNSTKDEKIEAIKKLGYKRSVARRIYTLYNDAE